LADHGGAVEIDVYSLRRLGVDPSGVVSIVDLVAGFVAVGCFGNAGLRRLFARHD
jgi:hypothetical protein